MINVITTQCTSAKTQNQIDHSDETKTVYSWLIPHCKPELKETTSCTTVGQAKDIARLRRATLSCDSSYYNKLAPLKWLML